MRGHGGRLVGVSGGGGVMLLGWLTWEPRWGRSEVYLRAWSDPHGWSLGFQNMWGKTESGGRNQFQMRCFSQSRSTMEFAMQGKKYWLNGASHVM